MFDLSKEAYVQNVKFNRADFERYTVIKAITEINQYSDLNVTYTKHKNGNKVNKYEFKWIKKSKWTDKPTPKKNPKSQNKILQKSKFNKH